MLQHILHFMQENYGIDALWLQLVDAQQKELYTHRIYHQGVVQLGHEEFFRKLRVPLKADSGSLFLTYKRKRPFYMRRIREVMKADLDRQIVERLQCGSILQIPLIVRDTVIGMLSFTTIEDTMKLPKRKIQSIASLCNQLAGAIQTSALLRQAEDAHLMAEQQRIDAIQARQEIEELNRISRQITETTALEEIVRRAFSYLKEKYNIESTVLLLVDKQQGEMYTFDYDPSLSDGKVDEVRLKNFRIPLRSESGSLYRTYIRAKPLYFRKLPAEITLSDVDAYIVRYTNMRSFLHVPLKIQDEVIAVAAFINPPRLHSLQIASISRFCEQIAGAIHSASLLRQVQQEKERTEQARNEIAVLNEFSRIVNQTTDVAAIFQDICKHLYRAYGIDGALLAFPRDDGSELYVREAYFKGLPADVMKYARNYRIPLNENGGMVARVYHRKRSFLVADTSGSRDIFRRRYAGIEIDRAMIQKLQLKSFFLLPLSIQGKAVAIMLLSSYERQLKLSKSDIQAIEAFGDQVAGALHTAELLHEAREARRAAERAEEESRTLAELARQANASQDPEEILAVVAGMLRDRFDADTITLYTADRINGVLRLVSVFYHAKQVSVEEFPKIVREIPIGQEGGALARSFRKKRPFHLPRISEEYLKRAPEADRAVAEAFQLKWFVHLPLLVRGEAVALLAFTGPDKERFSRSHLPFCERMAAVLAGIVRTTDLLIKTEQARAESERLLLNILPRTVATELKTSGSVKPTLYQSASIMFTDFEGFTKIAASMQPSELIRDLDQVFHQFDMITEKFGLEKIKTIGDAYMAAAGLPTVNSTHPLDVCLAALEIMFFMQEIREIRKAVSGLDFWKIRLGIHTGPVMAGVVGKNKFSYDIFGDAVNIASRCESTGVADRINISEDTWKLVKDFFDCEPRGQIHVKNRGQVSMYFLNRILPELSADKQGHAPNKKFQELRDQFASR